MLSNYPDGLSDYSVGTPWNDPDVPEKDFDVTCSQSLSKTTTVWTNNYIPGASGVDYEPDGEGGYCASGWHDPDNTSDTNWSEEYSESGHYTPLELINKFKEYLVKQWDILKDAEEANDAGTNQKKREIKHLIEECNDWIEDETEYIEE